MLVGLGQTTLFNNIPIFNVVGYKPDDRAFELDSAAGGNFTTSRLFVPFLLWRRAMYGICMSIWYSA